MTEHFLDRLDHAEFEQLDALFDACARHCLVDAERVAFLDWFETTAPAQAPLLAHHAARAGVPSSRYCRVLGEAVHASLPLPPAWRVDTLALPGRNEPCVCGSGQKYKQCCAGFAAGFDFSDYNALGHVLAALPDGRLAELADSQVDLSDLVQVLERWRDDGEVARCVTLLAPWFGPSARLTQSREPLLLLLLDAWQELGQTAPADALLARILEHGDRPLRAVALRERSYVRLAAGEVDGAWDDFAEVRRLTPSHPLNAVLELTLLIETQRHDEARERARFWLPRLERNPDREADAPFEFVQRVVADPATALDLPPMARIEFPELAALEELLQAAPPVLASHRLRAEVPGDPILEAEPALRRLEAQWADAYPVRKPPLMAFAIENDAAWADTARWLRFLAEHPRCWQSLEVLDDLALAVTYALGPGNDEPLLDALLDRGVAIVRALVAPDSEVPRERLQWGWRENRPALRLLAHHARRAFVDPARGRDSEDFIRDAELLLALNPGDEQGLRAALGIGYLARGQAAQVLALGVPTPDAATGVCLNGLLALYSAGQMDAAAAALTAIRADHALALDILLADTPQYPAPAGVNDDPGSRPATAMEAAIAYRETARDLWQAAGALDWLRAQRV